MTKEIDENTYLAGNLTWLASGKWTWLAMENGLKEDVFPT